MYDEDDIVIDIDELRDDMRNEAYGAFYGGGFGGALMEAFDIEGASDEEILEKALEEGIDIGKYQR